MAAHAKAAYPKNGGLCKARSDLNAALAWRKTSDPSKRSRKKQVHTLGGEEQEQRLPDHDKDVLWAEVRYGLQRLLNPKGRDGEHQEPLRDDCGGVADRVGMRPVLSSSTIAAKATT